MKSLKEIRKIIEAIKKNLTPDLLHKDFRNKSHPLSGHCYVASETAFHIFGKEMGYRPYQMQHEGVSHWFLKNDTVAGISAWPSHRILDLTSEQFQWPINYDKAVCRGFLTKLPSKRSQQLIARVNKWTMQHQ